MENRTATVVSGLALSTAVGVGLWLATADCMYSITRSSQDSSGATMTTEHCASLIETNGAGVVVVLAFPLVFTIVGLLSVQRRRRRAAWTSALLLGGFCILGLATVGVFYLPSLAFLMSAAALTPRAEAPETEPGTTAT